MKPPKVFVSYSHGGHEHKLWVLELAASLRKKGVDTALDQWDLLPGQDMTLFMESQIRESDFVILVCTPTYAEKSNIPRGGVGYEKNIISAEMLQSQNLRPKFIPLLRKGDFQTALPSYLGSKHCIDFRESRDQAESLDELLKAIHEVPPASKPPLGSNPFLSIEPVPAAAPLPAEPTEGIIKVDGHIESWAERALSRFEFLRETRIDKNKDDPFGKGYWQASFALQGRLRDVGLSELLEVLRKSETGRTGWDIGWVPTRDGITPYPFQDGIEVWLAEEGGKGPGDSDFWRAERIGTFSFFRGYQEDEVGFAKQFPLIQLDYSQVLWRIAEFLLYIESFSRNLAAGPASANLRIRWTGLENRQLGYRNALLFSIRLKHFCRQSSVEFQLHISDTTTIRRTLIKDLQK
ncbi:MAG: toll/interleukin-1 receptor domain-containing protein [Chloroflexi bacterium]|nr:toll/interleukin-1 receptor domain-containing protein [Chloroflexota bacterium]